MGQRTPDSGHRTPRLARSRQSSANRRKPDTVLLASTVMRPSTGDNMTRPDFTKAAVLRGGSIVAAGSIVSSALAALFTTILGVELGDEGFGIYAFVISTAGLLAIVARFGLPPIVVRNIARSVDEEKARLGTREPILTALGITTVLSLLLALLAISPLGMNILESAGDLDRSMVGALAVMFVAQALFTINAESLRGLHRLASASFLGLPVQRLVSLGLVAWVVYVAADDLDPGLALWLTAIAASAAAGASGVGLWLRIRDLPGGRPERSVALAMARDGAPVLLANALGLAAARLPVWVLAIQGTLDEAGVFALATAFVVLVRLASKSMAGTLSPFIATEYHSGSREALQRRVRIAAAGTSLLTIGGAIILIIVGTVAVPRLFGSNFEDAVVVASILLVATVISALAGPCGLLLNVTGNERWTARASLISLGLAAVVIIPAATAAGAIGSAAVMAATTVLNVGLQLRYAHRQTGIMTTADFRGLWQSLRRVRR